MEILYWPLWFIVLCRWLMRREPQELPEVQIFTAQCHHLQSALPNKATNHLETWVLKKIHTTIDTHVSAAIALARAGMTSMVKLP